MFLVMSRVQKSSMRNHHCDLEVTTLSLTQRTRVRSPVGSVSWLSFFWVFSSTVRHMSGNLGHIRLWLSFGHHIIIIQTIFSHLRTATVSDLRCSTWPSSNNQKQQVQCYENTKYIMFRIKTSIL